MKNEAKISDDEILNCVRYHHSTELSKAKIEENDNDINGYPKTDEEDEDIW